MLFIFADNQEKSAGKLPDIPKLKKTKPDSPSESPLEKLKRLENGEESNQFYPSNIFSYG